MYRKGNLSSDSGEGTKKWLPDLDSNQDKLNQKTYLWVWTGYKLF